MFFLCPRAVIHCCSRLCLKQQWIIALGQKKHCCSRPPKHNAPFLELCPNRLETFRRSQIFTFLEWGSPVWIACFPFLQIYESLLNLVCICSSVRHIWKQKLITQQPVDLEKISRCQNNHLGLLLKMRCAKVVPPPPWWWKVLKRLFYIIRGP